MAELGRHFPDAIANSSGTSSGSFTTLSHPSCYLRGGLIASNDSVSAAMTKSSVILPWPGTAQVLGKRCSLRVMEVLTAAPRDAGPVSQEQQCKCAETIPETGGVISLPITKDAPTLLESGKSLSLNISVFPRLLKKPKPEKEGCFCHEE